MWIESWLLCGCATISSQRFPETVLESCIVYDMVQLAYRNRLFPNTNKETQTKPWTICCVRTKSLRCLPSAYEGGSGAFPPEQRHVWNQHVVFPRHRVPHIQSATAVVRNRYWVDSVCVLVVSTYDALLAIQISSFNFIPRVVWFQMVAWFETTNRLYETQKSCLIQLQAVSEWPSDCHVISIWINIWLCIWNETPCVVHTTVITFDLIFSLHTMAVCSSQMDFKQSASFRSSARSWQQTSISETAMFCFGGLMFAWYIRMFLQKRGPYDNAHNSWDINFFSKTFSFEWSGTRRPELKEFILTRTMFSFSTTAVLVVKAFNRGGLRHMTGIFSDKHSTLQTHDGVCVLKDGIEKDVHFCKSKGLW